MTEKPLPDPYDPESYPPEEMFPAQTSAFEDGFTEQWRLLAQHLASGGDFSTAPRPDLDRFSAQFPRSAVEGIQQARHDAAEMISAGVYDADGIVRTLHSEDEEHRKLREARALVDGGEFSPPADPAAVRLHTTITRLFTQDVVHDAAGLPYKPIHIVSKHLRLDGPVFLLGHGEVDLGMSLKGDFCLDVVDADPDSPGSGVLTLRFLWGDPSTIVGAVEAGEIRGPNRWVGIGHAGASHLILEEGHRIYHVDTSDSLPLVHDERFGSSAWFWSASGGYPIFLAIDANGQPVGLILDSSGITNYYYFDDEDEAVFEPWPEGAREFDPQRDEPPDSDLPMSWWV
ncbi:hypothetical protein [Ornithinimicrobium avium]|uniref:Uncharacterized protein n=1 Tax=Ornithinimicrobium avium TaxID=2283195 RepID=A0A345NKF6_9MICO|nr:hypothetical protein [Ornithinimicrobium avium]AXH95514.1 hypothetical protein DV701_04660 [Ornithinimicrobium avium]